MIKAVFFDFDGTLLNSLKANAASYNYMFKKMHMPKMSLNKFRELFNVNFREFDKSVGIKESEAKNTDKLWFEKYYKESKKIKLFKGAKNFIKKIKKDYEIGLITGGTAKRVHADLKRNGLEGVFKIIITKEDHPKVKPDPHQILLACKKLKLKPEECVYVGDMDGDIIAAKRAKMKSIAVTWGFQKEEKLKRTNPDYIVNDFDELTKVIRSMG